MYYVCRNGAYDIMTVYAKRCEWIFMYFWKRIHFILCFIRSIHMECWPSTSKPQMQNKKNSQKRKIHIFMRDLFEFWKDVKFERSASKMCRFWSLSFRSFFFFFFFLSSILLVLLLLFSFYSSSFSVFHSKSVEIDSFGEKKRTLPQLRATSNYNNNA